MRCPRCDAETPEGARFCIECGTSLRFRCPQCGADALPRAKFCAECGTPLTAQTPAPPATLPSSPLQMGDTPEIVPVLYGLLRFYTGRVQLSTARELGETLLRLAQRTHDPALAVIAHYALGLTWFNLGVLPAARQHLEAGIARYTPDQRRAPVFRMGQDPGVGCRVHAARTLWLLGYPEQALAHVHGALALAQELSHPYSLAFARSMAAFASRFRRDVPAVHAQAEAAFTLSSEQGFPLWAASGTILRGWALAMQAQDEEGMAQVRQGITARRATGMVLYVPYFCTVLADVCDHLGPPDAGLQALAEAHTLVEQQEERWWEAEVHRLRGVLLLRQPGTPQAEAETWLRRALDVARSQEVKSPELRAAMSLSRLWQQQGKRDEAYELLAPIYGWFTEGFNTPDLQEANALLAELSCLFPLRTPSMASHEAARRGGRLLGRVWVWHGKTPPISRQAAVYQRFGLDVSSLLLLVSWRRVPPGTVPRLYFGVVG
jgi:predicted ATPase